MFLIFFYFLLEKKEFVFYVHWMDLFGTWDFPLLKSTSELKVTELYCHPHKTVQPTSNCSSAKLDS